jgi:hypothetical protein
MRLQSEAPEKTSSLRLELLLESAALRNSTLLIIEITVAGFVAKTELSSYYF